MQNIEIKSGTSADIKIVPKLGDTVVSADYLMLRGLSVFVFFVYQFTNKIFGEPYELKPDDYLGNEWYIWLSPDKTIEMLGNAEKNQKYEIQFAIKNANGDVVAEEYNSNVVIDITRWEAGIWLHQKSTK